MVLARITTLIERNSCERMPCCVTSPLVDWRRQSTSGSRRCVRRKMLLSAVRASLPARPPDTLPMRKPCRPSWKKWPCLGAPPNTWIEISLHRRRLSRLLRVAHGPILWPPCTTDTTNTPTCSPLKVRHSSLLNISPRHRRNIRAVRLERPVLPVFALGIFWAQALVRKSRCKVTQGLPHSRMLPIQNRLRQLGCRISRLRRPKNPSSKCR